MKIIPLSPSDKKKLVSSCLEIEAILNSVRIAYPQVKSYNDRQLLSFLKEMKIIQHLDAVFGDNLQPCAEAHEQAVDAVSELTTVQIKEIAGVDPNTQMLRMRTTKKVSDYAREILDRSQGKTAYLAVHNVKLNQVCVTPVINFVDRHLTYVNWNQLCSSLNARVIDLNVANAKPNLGLASELIYKVVTRQAVPA